MIKSLSHFPANVQPIPLKMHQLVQQLVLHIQLTVYTPRAAIDLQVVAATVTQGLILQPLIL